MTTICHTSQSDPPSPNGEKHKLITSSEPFMNIEEIREAALALPHATERSPYGPDTLAFEIGGRHFALLDLSGQWEFYNLKIDPEYSLELQERYRSVRPGWHMNKRHWVSVDFNGDLPDSIQRELLRHAYFQTLKSLPKRLRDELSHKPDADFRQTHG